MPFKTPKFWYRSLFSSTPIIEKILYPLSILYGFGQNLNLDYGQAKKISIPVICIGNITAGGSGKTPTIIALHKLIKKHKIFNAPYFLSRGYGGSEEGPRCIEIHDDASIVGDEPLLLLSHSKTIVSVDRYKGAVLAQNIGADCILMDDGFQNAGLYKDLSFLVIDGQTGLGNRKLLPAGPLRESIDYAVERTNAVIIIGKDQTDVQAIIPDHIPIFGASIKATNLNKIDRSQKYIGFAGLGHPKKFFDTLNHNNVSLVSFYEFADHHPYSEKEINALLDEAKSKNAKLITTEKDIQRISKSLRKDISTLTIELVWDKEKALLHFLKSIFKDV